VIGAGVDRLSTYAGPLFFVNILNAICSGLLALMPSFPIVVIVIVTTTALSIANQIMLRKLLPVVFVGEKLKRATVIMTEIAAVGAVFGPLVAPVFMVIHAPLSVLYAIDAISFLGTSLVYYVFFNNIRLHTDTKKSLVKTFNGTTESKVTLGVSITAKPQLKLFFIAFAPHIFAFSSLFFTLSLYHKKMSQGDELMFALPIISMFIGRMVASKYLKKHSATIGYDKIFSTASFASMLTMAMIGLCSNIFTFAILEFFLGMCISVLLYARTMWLQAECPIETLGAANGVLQTMESVAKLLGVPIVSFVVSNNYSWIAGVSVGLAFGLSGIFAYKPSRKIIITS
jgi:hypothetical protein